MPKIEYMLGACNKLCNAVYLRSMQDWIERMWVINKEKNTTHFIKSVLFLTQKLLGMPRILHTLNEQFLETLDDHSIQSCCYALFCSEQGEHIFVRSRLVDEVFQPVEHWTLFSQCLCVVHNLEAKEAEIAHPCRIAPKHCRFPISKVVQVLVLSSSFGLVWVRKAPVMLRRWTIKQMGLTITGVFCLQW